MKKRRVTLTARHSSYQLSPASTGLCYWVLSISFATEDLSLCLTHCRRVLTSRSGCVSKAMPRQSRLFAMC